MKLFYKRVLIIFSVALNIGFVIMAAMLFHHSSSSHGFSRNMNIVHRLDLPEAQEKEALDSIRRFRTAIKKQERKIELARDNIIRMVGKSGPLDQHRLHQLYEAANQEEITRNKLFEAHVIELRTLLGNEKGAQFYSLLLENLKNKNKSHHR